MDLLNSFFLFNLTASIAVLVAFFLLRDEVGTALAGFRLKTRAMSFNLAGAAGAATSLVLLTSVAALFR